MMGRQRKRCKQLLHELEEMTKYWKLNKKALACTLWRYHLGRGYRPVIRKTDHRMNDELSEAQQHSWYTD